MKFHERLKMLRTENGLTRTETAMIIGCSREIYGSWESGRRTPSLRHLKGMTKAFGVDYNKLLSDEYESVFDIADKLDEIIDDLKKLRGNGI